MSNAMVLQYLENAGVRSVALWAMAAFALWVCRVRSAAARHAVWTLVTVGMLAMLALQFATTPIALRVVRQTIEIPAVPVSTTPAAPAVDVATPVWSAVIVALWAIGALLSIGRLLYGFGFALRLLLAAREIEAGIWESDWITVPVTIGSRVVLPATAREWSDAKRAAVLAHERAHVQRFDWAISAMASVNRAIFWFHPLAWW